MEVNRREIYRYMGYGSAGPDERVRELTESCLLELMEAASPRSCSRRFPLRIWPDGTLDFSCFTVKSGQLQKNLEGCEEAVLFAATLGTGVDFLLRRCSHVSMSRAVVLQAASSALREAYCNQENERLKEEARARGFYLRPRFSPGYGDFPLEAQKGLFRALQAEKQIGVTLTDRLLMAPSKSVTAVIGAGRTDAHCEMEGCEACGKADCPYRRG